MPSDPMDSGGIAGAGSQLGAAEDVGGGTAGADQEAPKSRRKRTKSKAKGSKPGNQRQEI